MIRCDTAELQEYRLDRIIMPWFLMHSAQHPMVCGTEVSSAHTLKELSEWWIALPKIVLQVKLMGSGEQPRPNGCIESVCRDLHAGLF